MSVDYGPEAILSRLRTAAALTNLDTEYRLHPKVDYSAQAIEQRLREVQRALDACRALSQGYLGDSAE